MEFTDRLLEFGLTRQEATIYQTLLLHGAVTGYEAAKLTGISRSNTYSGLAGLVEKGAAYVIEGSATRYTPVGVKEFSTNIIRNLTTLQKQLIESAPKQVVECEGYITVKGKKHVENQLKNMLDKVEHRVYLLAGVNLLELLQEEMAGVISAGKKVVIVTDEPGYKLEDATVYSCKDQIHQFGMIIDSIEVLTGELNQGENAACLYTKNRNFVAVYKEMLRNKIRLIVLQGGKEA